MNRLIVIIILIAFCLVGYFAFSIFSKRESDLIGSNNKSTQEQQTATTDNTNTTTAPHKNVIANLLTNENTQSDNGNESSAENQSEEENIYINVTPPDCVRECEPYKYDEKELRYCQNVCGISENTSTNDCDQLKDLDKDYCYKDQAIKKKDASICDNISDTAIKKTCKNRIQEEIIEKM